MILAMAADALQIFVFPLFAEGALSPADDVFDLAVAAVLVNLLGWHWEFLPAFLAELVPGVDLVPFWTLAVVNVYRKWKQITITTEESREQRPGAKRPPKFVSRESTPVVFERCCPKLLFRITTHIFPECREKVGIKGQQDLGWIRTNLEAPEAVLPKEEHA